MSISEASYESRVRFTTEQLQAGVKRLAEQILKQESMYPDFIAPVLISGMMLATDLLRELYPHINPIVTPIRTIRLPSYVNKGEFITSIHSHSIDVFGGIKHKRVLIVDTVCRSGNTLNTAKRFISGKGPPRSVLTAALIWKNLPNAVMKPDFKGFDLGGRDEELVGYGLDKDGKSRGMSEVRV